MFFSKVVPETWSLITPFIDDILDELYDHALAHETTAKLFAGHNIEGLKAIQKSHWELTFKNGFDTSYEERAYRIGHSHAKIGLAPNIFTDSYGFMMERFVQRILASGMLTKHSVCAEKNAGNHPRDFPRPVARFGYLLSGIRGAPCGSLAICFGPVARVFAPNVACVG